MEHPLVWSEGILAIVMWLTALCFFGYIFRSKESE
jgi:hypothetical protein